MIEVPYSLLPVEIKDLQDANFDLSVLGFDEGELDKLLNGDGETVTEGETEPDAVPEAPEVAASAPGRIYQLGKHKLMCGDATKPEDVATLMGGETANLWLTDPPYNVAYEGSNGMTIENDNMENTQFRSFLRDAFQNVHDHMEPGASFYIFHADSEGYNFRGACHDIGLKVRQCLIWKKNALVLGRQDYQWIHEPCIRGWKEGAPHAWYNDRSQTTVMEFDKPKHNDVHPCLSPETMVMTRRGYVHIGEIEKGDFVLSDDGKFHEVTLVTKHPYREKIYCISVTGTNFSDEATHNHPYLSARKNEDGELEICWRDAECLQKDDFILTPQLEHGSRNRTEEQVYIQMEKECQTAHQKYEAEQNKIYLLLIERLQHLRKKFFASLELEKHDEADKILSEINDVQQEAKSIADVSQQVKIQNSRYIESLAELRDKLQKERDRIAKSEQMLADVFKAGTVKDLRKKIEAYLADFSDRPDAKQLYILQKNLSTIEKNAPEDPKWLQKDSIFHASAERFAKLQDLSEKLLRDVRSKYEKMADAYREDPQYAVIFTNGGLMYDFYFPKTDLPKWSRCGDEISFRVNVQMNENGKKENIKFILTERRGSKISAFFNSGEASEAKISGTPLYPQRISFRQPIGDFLAPHIRYVQKLAMELKKSEQETVEQTMINAIATLLANEAITPYLKVEFCSQMAKLLAQCVPDNKRYSDLSERAEKAKKAVSGKFNWMASYCDPVLQKQLRQDVIDLGVIQLKVDYAPTIERKILDAALTRKVVPIGYAKKTSKGMELKKFDSVLPSGEVWIAAEGKPYWKIVGTYSDNVLTLNSAAQSEVSDMQILYAPQDSRSTEKLKKSLEQEAKKANVNNITWPDIWPKVAGEK